MRDALRICRAYEGAIDLLLTDRGTRQQGRKCAAKCGSGVCVRTMSKRTPDNAESTGELTPPPALGKHGVVQRQAALIVLVGGQMGAAFALTSESTLIGRRAPAHISLNDDGVSRSHARVMHRDGCYEIEDAGSTNGTYVDGVRIQGRVPLQDGSRIQIGKTALRFALQDPVEWEASKRLYEAVVRDAATGAFNRRYFEQRLISDFSFAYRHGTALCVLLIDIDHFKRINDRWGHLAGDMVLQHVGAELLLGMRADSLLARYGGEEFAVLARGIDADGAFALAERLRASIEHMSLTWESERIAVTASVGVAHTDVSAKCSDPQRLVAAADSALYAAKAAGRNCVRQNATDSDQEPVRVRLR